MSDNGFPGQTHRTPCQAIHIFCASCIGEDDPRDCEVGDCPLYLFRTGHNPHRTGIGGNPTAARLAKAVSTQKKRAENALRGE
jgi:hypothetical protein